MQSALFILQVMPMVMVPRQLLRVHKIHMKNVVKHPQIYQKKQRIGEAILCMLGDKKTSFRDALKSTESLPLPQVLWEADP